MPSRQQLADYLAAWAGDSAERATLASLVAEIAAAGIRLSRLITTRELEPETAADAPPGVEDSADEPMDSLAHKLFAHALSDLPVSALISADAAQPQLFDSTGRYAVVLDPLDGAANVETNLSIGTLFAIFRSNGTDLVGTMPGERLEAAGFFYYGPQTRLVLSCGEGSFQFLLDPENECFHLMHGPLSIPSGKREFAINTANYRFWDSNLRHFIDDCIAGEEGAMGKNFNMRWSGSLVAETYRILKRGGVFLYPGDARPNFSNGRLRLLYHALPLALIVEQAGGAASDGSEPILSMRLAELHMRVPLIFGCKERVHEVLDYISGVALDSGHYPLFVNRGLLRN